MQEKLNKLTVFSPAKVNLHLEVKDKRPDGFHDIESVFLAVNFGDTLHFSLLDASQERDSKVDPSGLIEISMNGPALKDSGLILSPQRNIIYRAITLFREKTDYFCDKKVIVSAEKRIPIGGGLGGGSSNAASTLLALNKMAPSPLDRSTLLEMASVLGSDVVFFVYETRAAYVSGRGEIIKPFDSPPMFLTLVNPGFSSDTARAFGLLDKTRSDNFHAKKREESDLNIDISSMFFTPSCSFKNDFLSVFPQDEKSIYENIIFLLYKSGAVYANLSGTGATCFGVFTDEEAAQKAARDLRASDSRWLAEFCKTL